MYVLLWVSDLTSRLVASVVMLSSRSHGKASAFAVVKATGAKLFTSHWRPILAKYRLHCDCRLLDICLLACLSLIVGQASERAGGKQKRERCKAPQLATLSLLGLFAVWGGMY